MAVSAVLFALLVLQIGRLLVLVSTQPPSIVEVSLRILTPEAERTEGGRLEMRCVVTTYDPDIILEWRTNDVTLTRGESVVSNNSRFAIQTTRGRSHLGLYVTDQVFNITDLRRGDSGEYTCSARSPFDTEITSSVMLSVLYFPSESFPMCFPDGSITVDTGTELNVRCTSEVGNPPVTMSIDSIAVTPTAYLWSELIRDGDSVWMTMNLTVDQSHDVVAFHCLIISQSTPVLFSSCTIGPIRVRQSTRATTQPTTVTTTDPITEPVTHSLTDPTPSAPSSIHPSAIASMAALLGLILVAVLTICVVLRSRKRRAMNHPPRPNETQASNVDTYADLQPTDDKKKEYQGLVLEDAADNGTPYETVGGERTTNVLKPDAYMELQPVDDTKRDYMGLTARDDGPNVHQFANDTERASHESFTPGEIDRAQHVYHQTVEEDDEDLEHDYVEPDQNNSVYETVKLP